MHELCTLGSERGAISNERPYRNPADRVARIDRLEFDLLPLTVFCLLMIDLLGVSPSLRAVEA